MGKIKQYKSIKYSMLPDLYLIANGFRDNYEELKEKISESVGKVSYNSLIPVAATNAFFAIELYLKLCYSFHFWEQTESQKDNPDDLTQYPNKHSLRKLYDTLDGNTKQLIFKIASIESLEMEQQEFVNILDENDDGFIQWRYIFEKDTNREINLVHLSAVLKMLYCYCTYLMGHHQSRDEWNSELPHTTAKIEETPIESLEDIQKVFGE